MKQNRKIKSLLPQKQKQQTYLMTTILLILSLVFCIGTAVLITSSVLAAPISQPSQLGIGQSQESMGVSIQQQEFNGTDSQLVGNPVSPVDIQVGHQIDPGNLQMPGGDSLDPNGGSTHGKTQGGDSPENGDNNIVETVYKQFEYDGIDNNAEVVYGIRFVNPLNMSQIRNSIFIQDQSLNISPNPIVVNLANCGENCNIVNKNLLGIREGSNHNYHTGYRDINTHILGGQGNTAVFDNVTMIAGENNTLYDNWHRPSYKENSPNALILGGKDNDIFEGFIKNSEVLLGTFPIISIGGKNNVIGTGGTIGPIGGGTKGPIGVGTIGGENNKIEGLVDTAFIVGGENNKIIYDGDTLRSNVIVGGKNVTVSGMDNLFAYSNSDYNFAPKSSNAFYLNMEKGVGVNTTGEDKGLFVNEAVYVGEVDITKQCRSESDYGIIGSYSGCLVGCTKVSSDGYTYKRSGATVRADYVWEMLDLGENCKKICKDEPESCISSVGTENTAEETNRIYTDAQCTDNVNTGNATICSRDKNFTGGYREFYKNVVFETVLLDSDSPCPEGQENQCVYKCNSGYHLTGDAADGTLICHKDCELPWDNTKKIKHNERIIAYNITGVSCSNDIYVFPLGTQIINVGFPALSPTGLSRNTVQVHNVLYPNRATNGRSPETCGNYDHKKTLICKEGDLFLMKENGQPITSEEGKTWVKEYKYESCSLSSYSCNTSVYSLTKGQIQSDKLDEPKNNGTRDVVDREVLQGIRGRYTGCVDYTVNPNPTTNGESCSKGEYHYAFIACQPGYHTGQGYEDVCMKDCTLKSLNGIKQSYRHRTEITGYVDSKATCTETCQAAKLFCDDGNWRLGSIDGNVTTGYTYNDCTLKNKTCPGFNVSSDIRNQYISVSEYTSCDLYNGSGRFECVPNGTKYKLVNCATGYHATGTSSTNLTHCIPNAEVRNCTNKWRGSHGKWDRSVGGIVQSYPGYGDLRQEDRNLQVNSGQYIVVWTGTWNNGHWTGMYPENACDWRCDDGWHKSGNECKENECIAPKPITGNYTITSPATRPSGNENKPWKYITGAYLTNYLSGECEWGCKDGSHKVGNTCILNECRYCANDNLTNIGFPYCFPMDFSNDCKENRYYNEYFKNNN